MERFTKSRLVNICVFCGANPGINPEFVKAAEELGRAMVKRKMHLIYGGGNLGLMGVISRTMKEGGSQVLGIVPQALAKEHLIGKTNGEELVVSDILERITEVVTIADAFIALPGGLGTMEEIFTVLSWRYLYIHRKPIGLLNTCHFYDFLLVFLDDVKRLGFTNHSVKDFFFTATTVDDLLDQLQMYVPLVDPIFSKLDWSGSKRGKKRNVDLNLKL